MAVRPSSGPSKKFYLWANSSLGKCRVAGQDAHHKAGWLVLHLSLVSYQAPSCCTQLLCQDYELCKCRWMYKLGMTLGTVAFQTRKLRDPLDATLWPKRDLLLRDSSGVKPNRLQVRNRTYFLYASAQAQFEGPKAFFPADRTVIRSSRTGLPESLARANKGSSVGDAEQSAATASARSNAWKAQRRSVEWRIRWLEHRLRELRNQQLRHASRLRRAQETSTLPDDGDKAGSAGRASEDATGKDQLAANATPKQHTQVG